MKAVLGLLLILGPFLWFYIKHYSKKGYVRMQVSMFLEKLYAELQAGNTDKAARLVIEFLNKAADENIEYFHQLENLPLTAKNQACLSFIDRVAEIESKALWDNTPERIKSLIER